MIETQTIHLNIKDLSNFEEKKDDDNFYIKTNFDTLICDYIESISGDDVKDKHEILQTAILCQSDKIICVIVSRPRSDILKTQNDFSLLTRLKS